MHKQESQNVKDSTWFIGRFKEEIQALVIRGWGITCHIPLTIKSQLDFLSRSLNAILWLLLCKQFMHIITICFEQVSLGLKLWSFQGFDSCSKFIFTLYYFQVALLQNWMAGTILTSSPYNFFAVEDNHVCLIKNWPIPTIFHSKQKILPNFL